MQLKWVAAYIMDLMCITLKRFIIIFYEKTCRKGWDYKDLADNLRKNFENKILIKEMKYNNYIIIQKKYLMN